jgi:hypothetical protein
MARFFYVYVLGIDGSEAVRNILHRCYFDEEKCSKGIQMLDNYRKEWNDPLGCWRDRPLHNFASHGADSFRIMACGLALVDDKYKSEESQRAAYAFLNPGFNQGPAFARHW